MTLTLEVPAPIRAFLDGIEFRREPVMAAGIFSLDSLVSVDALTDEQRRGVWAEIAAWRFSRPHLFEVSSWGIYWRELASGTNSDGKRVYLPDINDVDVETLEYWIQRARSTTHPAFRARYADLSWELSAFTRKRLKRAGSKPTLPRVTPDIVEIAIEGYLATVTDGLCEDEGDAWLFVHRAIELAKQLRNDLLVAKTRAALFTHLAATPSGAVTRWRFHEIVWHHFRTDLTADEQRVTLDDLQRELATRSDSTNPTTFDPHRATDTADRLRRWSDQQGNADTGKVAVAKAAAAFESAATQADGLLAMAWLEPLIARYRSVGDMAGANRVEAEIRRRSADAQAEMRHASVPLELEKQDVDAWAARVAGDTLTDALRHISAAGLIRYDSTAQRAREVLKDAPLVATIPMTLIGPNGFTTATIGGIDDDEEGRAFNYAAQEMQVTTYLLAQAFAAIRAKHEPTAAQICEHIYNCPYFDPVFRPIVERGVEAWLKRDPMSAIHLLIPRIEAALREVCAAIGGTITTYDENTRGFRFIGMGAILRGTAFVTAVPRDIRFHLETVFVDARALNMRNHVAHGLIHPEALNMGNCNWVMHALLTVALLAKPEKKGDAPSNSGAGADETPPAIQPTNAPR